MPIKNVFKTTRYIENWIATLKFDLAKHTHETQRTAVGPSSTLIRRQTAEH